MAWDIGVNFAEEVCHEGRVLCSGNRLCVASGTCVK
jgi:hypothetical protein